MFRKWRDRRAGRKQAAFVLAFILAELEKGTHHEDILVWEIDSPVEWDKELQTWKVDTSSCGIDLELKEHSLIFLSRGRGDAKEHARVVDTLGNGWYSLRFDVENRSTEEMK